MTNPHLTAKDDRIVRWFAAREQTGYLNEIDELAAQYDEIRGEAGRYWQQCDVTQRQLSQILAQQQEVLAAAHDRYNDLASD